MRRPANIMRLMGLCKAFESSTWDSWRVIMLALFGLPLSSAQLATFRDLTGRSVAPTTPARELWAICGRRSGKSRVAALVAVFMATCRTYRLAPGERGVFMVLAADRLQARVVKRYVLGLLEGTPILAQLIANVTRDAIALTNGITLEIHTSSFRTIRGYTLIGAECDEVAFWNDEDSANPDREVLTALRPAMATVPEALLLCMTSPYARRGEAYRTYQEHYGRDDDPVLVVKAPTTALNPTVSQSVIDTAYTEDPASARAEWGAEFRSDVAALLTLEALAAVVPVGVFELSPDPARAASLHFDAATGSGEDAAAAAIAFEGVDNEVVELAAIRRWAPPFSPSAVVKETAELAASYGISEITIDRFAPGLVADLFSEHGIRCTVMERDTSAAFVELLALINSQRVRLLDEPALLRELQRLERRAGSSGRDIVSHPMRGHDDVAAACAGALLGAKSGRGTYRCTTCRGHGCDNCAGTGRLRDIGITF